MTVRSLNPAPRGFHGDTYLLKLVDALARNAGVFIETGSNVGSTLGDVARRYPDLECFSCEPDPEAFAAATNHACVRPSVHLTQETSQQFIKGFEASFADRFERPVLAWLDAHDYGFEWPLRDEIAFLTKNFTRGSILIDDFEVPGRPEFGWDQYDGHLCSFGYIESAIDGKVAWRLSYPSYTEHTSKWHPLRGWGLLQFAPTLDELPVVSAFMPDVCAEATQHDPIAPKGPTPASDAPLTEAELDAAIAAVEQQLRENPGDPLLWNDIGVCLALRGSAEDALFALGQALNIDPAHADAHANYRAVANSQGPKADRPLPVAPGLSGRMVARDPYQDLQSLVDLPEPVIVDGGASRGDTVAKLRNAFPKGTIHAFEPIPELAEAVRERFRSDDRVVVSRCALSSAEGPLSFRVRNQDAMSSMLEPSQLKERYHPDGSRAARTVETLKRRLDRALPSSPDILKLDVQGHEIEALEGAGSTLEGVRVILAEVEFAPLYEGQPLFGDVDAYLRKRGFRLLNLYELWSHPDGQLTSGDAIYVNGRYYA